ncbi:MAG: AF1514 family protein [Gammaproteobacteria bacterium]|nr:AF1514 family protein [Gammaproteobacteria bacterium]
MNDGPSSSRKTGASPASADEGSAACPLPSAPDLSGVMVVPLHPGTSAADYLEAMRLANATAAAHLNDPMLLSWYDRDRDFEAPQHVSECHQTSAVPGYVDYGIHHGATLMVDVENGRFVFFYRPADV